MEWLPEFDWDIAAALFACFVVAGMVQLYFYWNYFGRLAFFRPVRKKDYPLPVSVVICARNEHHHLVKTLPAILEQDYPDFEVILVDDASDDDTSFLLQQLQNQHPHLKVITLRESVNFFKGKKLPLSVGIKSAKHDVVLLTEPACSPASQHWIRRMADNFYGKKQIVLGYGSIETKAGLLNKLIRFDNLFTAMKYFGMAIAGKAYMGIGRNLSYKKDLFFKFKGFTSHYKITSGDDDLFVNQAATPFNVAIEISHHSHTVCSSGNSFKEWLRQKRKYMASGRYYKKKHRRMLGVFSLSNFLFYPLLLLTVILFGMHVFSFVAASVFFIRLITLFVIFLRLTRKLNERKLFAASLFIEVLHPFISLMFGVANLFHSKDRWK